MHENRVCREISTLADLNPEVVRLLTTESDGSVRAVKGGRMTLQGTAYFGAPPVLPEPGVLD